MISLIRKIPKSPKTITLFLCCTSALLLVLSFPRSDIYLFAFIGFVPLFFAIKGKRPYSAFKIAYLAGVLFFFGIIYWLTHVTLAGMVALVLYLSVYFAIFGLTVSYVLKRFSVASLIIIPSVWVVLEYIRAHLFSGFGWESLGYSQYLNLSCIQIADITGVYGVSFFVMFCNVAVYSGIAWVTGHRPSLDFIPRQARDFARDRQVASKKIISFACIVCLVIFFVVVYGRIKLKDPNPKDHLRISLVAANIPVESTWDQEEFDPIVTKHIDITKNALGDSPDLIIWPETSIPYQADQILQESFDKRQIFIGDQYKLKELFNFIREVKTPLLTGIITQELQGEAKYYNSAILISDEGKLLKRYNKIHLVPFGEYIPFRDKFKFLELIIPIEDFTSGSEYVIFKLNSEKISPVSFAVLICFEDIFPSLARNFTKNGAQFLVNITNDAWFKDTSSPFQHMHQAVFRAVENRRPLVRAANTGVSCFIDKFGVVYSYLKNRNKKKTFISGHKSANLYYDKDTSLTFYTKYGDLFVLLCLISSILGLILLRLSPTTKSSPN